MPKLVLHVCCAPCSSAVIGRLNKHFDITYYYYNPNIFPETEFNKRKEEFKKLGVSVVDNGYNHKSYLVEIAGLEQAKEGGDRCKKCIAMRMRSAFEYAKQTKADYVTTTLSISPHKDAEFINKTGEMLEKEYNIKYLYADFKKENGYLNSTKICKEKGIYRQDYCGCEFAMGHKINNND